MSDLHWGLCTCTITARWRKAAFLSAPSHAVEVSTASALQSVSAVAALVGELQCFIDVQDPLGSEHPYCVSVGQRDGAIRPALRASN